MDAEAIIAALALTRHPEGGWYRETYRDPPPPGGRSALSQIYYLLQAGERSRWHRIDAVEIWQFHHGAPLALRIAVAGGLARTVVLGVDFTAGACAQTVVPALAWQSAATLGAFTLVGCTVVPAFRFEGFELAAEGWRPDGFDAP